MSVLVKLFQWTIALHLMISLTESRNLYSVERIPDQEVFLSQLPEYLSLIEFNTQEECVRAMCSPKRSRRLDQLLTFSTRSNIMSVPTSGESPYSRSESSTFEDLKNVLKSGSHIIKDGQNNAIGLAEDPEQDDKANIFENPSYTDSAISNSEHKPTHPSDFTVQSYDLSYSHTYNNKYSSSNGGYGGIGGYFGTGGYGSGYGGGLGFFSSSSDSSGKSLKPSIPSSETNVCCSTVDSYFINSTLVDVNGTTRTIAQMKHIGTYQIIRHGFCGKRGVCPGIQVSATRCTSSCH